MKQKSPQFWIELNTVNSESLCALSDLHLLVVHLSKGAVSLLTSCVPHFELNNVLIELYIFRHERATDCWLMGFAKFARVVSNADACFSDAHVAKQYNLVSYCWLIR